MKIPKLICIVTVILSFVACSETSGPKEQVGTLLGAAAGAVAGSAIGSGRGQLAGTAAGTLLGAFLGSKIGESLDRADIMFLEKTQQTALETTPSGTETNWVNPDSGNSGRVTPTRTYQNANGTYCREFQQTIIVSGNEESAYGTACRQPDGTWKIIGG